MQQEKQRPPATYHGIAAYEDGVAAGGALIAITSLASGSEVGVVTADRDGRFEAALPAGEYALAVSAEHGSAYVEATTVPNLNATITVSRTCRVLTGRANGAVAGTQVSLARKSRFTGDVFVTDVRADGTFSACLPEGHYGVVLRGPVVSLYRMVDLATPASAATVVEIDGIATTDVKQPPREVVHVPADLDGLVADILDRDARVIGLGEATHGTAELTSSRATLTFELIRRANVRLVLFEVDAMRATALDDYVMGADVDLGKAVAGLGFWITDTLEFLRFFEDLRAYNATTRDKVHVWGVDVQNTEHPVSLLRTHARALKLTADDEKLLAIVAEKRAFPVKDLPPDRRRALDVLLARLSKPRGKSQTDLRIAVAARSLIVQLGYLDVHAGLIGARRDAGMASLTSYLVTQTGAPRACIWAHAGHVARDEEVGTAPMGEHLAAVPAHRYYPIGFYVYEGAVRAWDAAGEIGVISHPIPPGAAYTVEAAVMSATRSPDIAWLPSSRYSPLLRKWLDTPRYVREVGSAYSTEEDTMALRNVPAAFDALVVIKKGHASSPTPTGVRKVDK